MTWALPTSAAVSYENKMLDNQSNITDYMRAPMTTTDDNLKLLCIGFHFGNIRLDIS